MDVRVMPLVVERGIPAEVLRRNVHRRGDLIAVCAEQVAPRFRVVTAEPRRVLARERDDVRPHVALVVFQFIHCRAQIGVVLVTEEPV